MKQFFALPFLLLVAAIPFLVGCPSLSGRVDEAALFGPARLTWPSVKEDLHRGVFRAVGDETLTNEDANVLLEQGDELEQALDNSDTVAIRLVPWRALAPWASKGIDAKLAAEEIGHGVAASLREQLLNFTAVITKLQTP